MARPQNFRIAHLSDLHLTETVETPRIDLPFFKPLKGMNTVFQKIVESSVIQESDLVLVTGDVTDFGNLDSWRIFWETIDNAGLAERILVLPGNHDVCCLKARIPEGGKYRKEDLEKAVVGLKMGQQPINFPWVVSPDSRVVVFGLNSNNLGNFSVLTNAMGKLGYFQLKSLAWKLHTQREVPVKIIALHHSPNIPRIETAKKRGQRPVRKLERIGHQIPKEQRRALLLLCIAHRVRLLVHGHIHLAEVRRVSNVRIVGASATTEPISSRKGGNNYQFFTYMIQGKGGRVRCDLCAITV